MMRSLTALAWAVFLVLMGACVNVDKPAAVVECEKADGGCTNHGGDGSAGPGADVKPAQDAAGNGSPDGTTVKDGPASSVPDVSPVGPSDGVPDLPSGVVQDASLDVAVDAAKDIAQDVARDGATDLASGPCWNAGSPVAAGTICRLPVGLCDVEEVCDGINAACPADAYAPSTNVCRPAAGDCDIAESCSGSSPDCPADAFLTAGEVCRPATGICDLAESCSGVGPDCPADSLVPAGTVCRASTDSNQCDPAETCTGTSVSCPADVKYTRPAAPTGVTAAPGTLQSTISWTAVAGATGYNVKQSVTSGSGYTTQGTPPTATASPYVNTGLTGGTTYYYVVTSVNTVVTCESANSTEVSVKPSGICTPPAAPTVTPTSANGQVSLTWTASTGATSYTVARSTTTGTGYVSVATITTGTTYSDVNVSNGTTYYYVVTASNGSCSSDNSVEVSASPSCVPPAAPTNLVATANNGSVALTWTAPTGAISYRILRSTTSGSGYTLVGTSGTASYTDTSVTNGTTYYYVVTASNGSCSSANSAEKSATPACTPPSAPTNLTATPGNGQIVLAWTASTGGAVSYQVLRGTKTGGPYTAIATPTSTGYTDTGLINGTTYYYVVTASNGSCSSANSTEASAAPVCTPPSVPTITATPGDGQVVLSWTAATGGAVSYVVSRGTVSGGPYGTVVASPTGTTFTDQTVVNGTTYYYVVSSSNGTCQSLPSTQASATPVAACTLVAPTGVTATAGNQQVTLNWTAVTGATSYNIGRSTTTGTGYASAGTVTAPTVTFVDTGATLPLSNGTKYYYVITASNTTCTSPTSTEVSATPACVPPTVPTGVTATANTGNGNIAVSWGTVAGATGYTVSRGTSASGPFIAVSSNQTAATYTDSTGLTAGTTYFYVVSASSAAGTCASGNSTPAVSAMSCTLPPVPIGLTATGGNAQVALIWTASTGATSYNVLRGTASGGPYTSIATPTTASYTDTGRTNGTTYYYVVTARNGANNACVSAQSSQVSATPRACPVATSQTFQPNPQTTGAFCLITCDAIAGWGCANMEGRTITVNGTAVTCPPEGGSGGSTLPAKVNGAYTFNVSAGTYGYASIDWWGTVTACPQ